MMNPTQSGWMLVISVLIYNLLLFGLFAVISGLFNGIAWIRARAKTSKPILAWTPGRREWHAYLRTKGRSYLMSFILFLGIFIVLSTVFARGKASLLSNLTLVLTMMPGLAGYVLIIWMVPNKYAFHPEGITSFGWLHYSTGRRGTTVTEARVGFQPWTKFIGYGWDEDVLLLRTKFASQELVTGQNKGQIRDLLRERFKEASKVRRQARSDEQDKSKG